MLLKTFGGLNITGAETQRRRLCLLAVLAEAGAAGVTRDKLVGLFWPETDEERARGSLAQALYALRRDLGAEDVIEGTTTLRLNESRLPSDIGSFHAALREGRFQEAAHLYTGPFLDGVHLPEAPEFERWLDERRSALAHEAAAMLEQAAATSRDVTAAAALWRRRAAMDPCDARVAMALMRALAAAGDRAGAIRHAQVHETLVREELGIGAEPAVHALAEELRRQPDAPVPARAESSAPDAVPPPPPTLPRRRSTVAAAGALVAAVALAALVLIARRRDAPAAPALPGSTVLAIGLFNSYGEGAAQLSAAVTDLLSTSLARSSHVTVLSGARLYELMDRRDDADSTRRVLQAARAGGATHLVDGALYLQGGTVRLDLRRTAVADGRVVQAMSIQAADLFAAVDSGTRRLLQPLGATPEGSIADVTTGSLAAFRLYSAGLREFFAFRRDAAYALFTAALAEDSLFAMAEFQAWQTAPSHDAGLRHLNRAIGFSSRASERERLLIRWSWASLNDEHASVALAESLVSRFAAEPFAHVALASTLHTQGRFAESNAAARRALALDHGAPMRVTPGRCIACDARGLLVWNYRLLDSGAAAEREAHAFTREYPRVIRAWVILAEQLLSEGKVEEGHAARRRSIELGEQLDFEEYRAATAMFDMDYERLDRWFTARLRAGDAEQRRAAAWWLTLSYRAQGRLRDALETASIMRDAGPVFGQRNVAPYEALSYAQVLAEMGRPRESAALYEAISRLRAPGTTDARWARHRAWFLTHAANSRAMAGDTAGLLALADTVEAYGRQSAFARDQRLHHHVRGLVYAARGAHREAVESFTRAIYSPVVGYTRTNLALAASLTALGRPREAIPWLRAALKGGAEGSNLYLPYSDLHEALAHTFVAAGERDSARAHAAIAARAWARADESHTPRRSRMVELAGPATREE